MTQQRSSRRSSPARKRARKQQQQQVEVRFERTRDFRTIHVDGAWGGASPNGGIVMSLYHQHQELPSSVTLAAKAGGVDEVSRTGGEIILREIEVQAQMSPATARVIAQWLIEKANEVDQVLGQLPGAGESPETPGGAS